MKFRIIGILVAAAICAAIYLVSSGSGSSGFASGGGPNEGGIRNLNIQ